MTADLLSTLQSRGTLSAQDLSSLTGLPLGQVVATLRNDLWWTTEIIPGPSGWLYRLRHVLNNKRVHFPAPKQFNDEGITKQTNWAPA